MSKKVLSIITITFNNFSELKRTIDSLPDSDLTESVVVNGGKCLETLEFLEKFKGISASEKDKGISDAFNKGFHLSSGDYITYLNSGDSLIDPNYYSKALSILNTNQNIDFIYADICFVDKFAGELYVRSNGRLPKMSFLHPTLIIRRSVMESIGLFDLSFKVAMDLDFVYRLIRSEAKGHYIPQMVVRMDGNGISSTNFIRTYIDTLRVIIKNRDLSFYCFIYTIKTGIFLLMKMLLLKSRGNRIIGWYRKSVYNISRK